MHPHLIKDLDAIIVTANACAIRPPRELPWVIRSLPAKVTKLRESIKSRKGRRFPIWECIKTIDATWPEKGLVYALENMFRGAIVQEPLKTASIIVAKDPSEMAVFERLEKHLELHPDVVPKDLSSYGSILEKLWNLPGNRWALETQYLHLAVGQLRWEQLHQQRTIELVVLAEELNSANLNQRLASMVRSKFTSHLLLTEDQIVEKHKRTRGYGYVKTFRQRRKAARNPPNPLFDSEKVLGEP